ncbi:MAG: Phage integrase family protein [Syntrophorhabdus sp. PtaU1.Bin050]|nr:MAG: Phage integrase family protein [Syntrophorhabdus sp. PtaU1.Bin050]
MTVSATYPNEANRRLALLHHILQKAVDWGYLTTNLADRIKKFKEKRHKLKLTKEILFEKIYPVADEMLKRAIMLAFHLVQHENEIKHLKWNEFRLNTHVVEFIRQKTDEPIVINFSENPILTAYMEHVKGRRENLCPYIIHHQTEKGRKPYSSFRSMWNRALTKAGYNEGEFKFKEIRHLANTTMKDHSITADKRKGMTGHQSTAANEIYTHPTPTDTY